MTGLAVRRLRLEVPALIERPHVMGPLCCAPAAGDLLESELRSWRVWVSAVEVSGDCGRVELVVADGAPLKDMLEALEDLGYPVQSISDVTPADTRNTRWEVAHAAA